MKKAVLYLNQFFGQIGGEDKADFPPEIKEGLIGPAFQAGRYGVACGNICKAVKEKFNVPVITSMHVENPGVDMFKIVLILKIQPYRS